MPNTNKVIKLPVSPRMSNGESKAGPKEAAKTSRQCRPGVLDPHAPLDNARKFVRRRCWNAVADFRTLQFWQGEFWEWRGTHWKRVDENTMRSRVYEFLDAAQRYTGRGLGRFLPQSFDVNKTIDALKSVVNLSPDLEMPSWLEGAAPMENPRELVACRNGLLDVASRRLLMHTPRFWSPNVLEFDFDPKAKAPRFKRFLKELFPNDRDAQERLLEMIGLCVTDETKYQKAFMFVGPPRGGRGTIGRLLRGLIGEENYAGGSLEALSESFGMEAFIGKKVVVFSDVHLDGAPLSKLSIATERVKSITGEDLVAVNRKYLKYWHGRLQTRLIFFSNELLRFQDDSLALAGRFIHWRMSEQFIGPKQDPDLTDKLLAERPGILNLALKAVDQLRQRGRFLQPASGLEMTEELGELSSDVAAFVAECCVIAPSAWITSDELFEAWQVWCVKKGIRPRYQSSQLSAKIRAAVPTVRWSRPRNLPNGKANPKRLTALSGIGKAAKSRRRAADGAL
jgi:putative DNA primase/helicase